MSKLKVVMVPRLPDYLVRTRCACAWWITPKELVNRSKCRYCDVIFVLATEQDYAAIGVEIREEDESDATRKSVSSAHRPDKRRRRGSTGESDPDNRGESGLW